MWNIRKISIISMMFFAWLWGISESSMIGSYIDKVKATPANQTTLTGSIEQMDTALIREWNERIEKEAQKLRIEPVNAVIDQVWKAIPGYNGLEVDMEKTLKLAMDQPLNDHIPFVFREIEPIIQLEDLAPHPIYKGNPHKPMIAFMINVAWGNEYIPDILATLKEENVKSTFFLDGTWLLNNSDIARKILEEGHELSNHAYSHKNMSTLSASQARKEIVQTEKLLAELNVKNRWFAPPSGDFDMETVQVAHQMGLKTVLWSIDTLDWKKPTPDWILRRIEARIEPGSMILMHPTLSSSQALKGMIQIAKQRDLVIGTISDLISSKRVSPVESIVHF